MNLEEAFVYELSTIAGFEGKIFPLEASEGVESPFIVYVSSEGEKDKTLSGYLDSKVVVIECHVVHKRYDELKRLTREVLNKLETFFGRQIGVDGPFIKDVSYEAPVEVNEKEVKLKRSSFDIKIRL